MSGTARTGDRRPRAAAGGRKVFAWLAFGAVLPLALAACRRPAGTRLVLITLDTLRYDSFAGEPSAMPRLRRYAAARCLSFERFYAATSSTQPSHATLFTALHPWQHGVSRNGLVLGEQHVTIAEALREAGFATAAVVASFPVSRRFGFAQGFDDFHDEFAYELKAERWEDVEGPPEDAFYSLGGEVAGAAIAAFDAARGGRQFFWLHFFDPHAPYGDTAGGETLRPREVVQQIVTGAADGDELLARARALYARDVESLDRHLDRVLQRLERDAEAFDTHVAIVSDHGESLGEDGSMAHGKRLTAGQIHVPLLVCSPRVAAGTRREVAGSIDVPRTLLELAGVAEARLAAGRDLTAAPPAAPRAFGMRRSFATPYLELRLGGQEVVLEQNLFYVVEPDGSVRLGNGRRLGEEDAAATASPAPAGDGAGRYLALFRAFEAELAGRPAEELADAETRRALEALGYVR